MMLLARQAILAHVFSGRQIKLSVGVIVPFAMKVVIYGWDASPIREGSRGPSLALTLWHKGVVKDKERQEITNLFYDSFKEIAAPHVHWYPHDELPTTSQNYHHLVDYEFSVFHKGYELRGHITEVIYMSGKKGEEENPYIYMKLIKAEYVGEENVLEDPFLQEDEAPSPEDEVVVVED